MIPVLRPIVAGAVALAGTAVPLMAQSTLYRSDAFTVTDTSVEQGRWRAVALSRDSIVSTYPRAGREMHFRFSLNGQDNEFPSGTEHTLYIRPAAGQIVSPVYVFGQEQPPFIPTPEAYATSEEGVAQVRIGLADAVHEHERQAHVLELVLVAARRLALAAHQVEHAAAVELVEDDDPRGRRWPPWPAACWLPRAAGGSNTSGHIPRRGASSTACGRLRPYGGSISTSCA